MKQQAYDLLRELEIAYERHEHKAITSVLDLDFTLSGQQVKNLVLKNKKGNQLYLVILRDEKQANLAQLAENLGEKRPSFVKEEVLEEILHVPAGTVTPFSMLFDVEHKIEVVVDADVDQATTVGFHPFINSTTLNIDFKDFEKILAQTWHQLRTIAC
ncbi:YbaK/EbsC family protein [Streptococcus sp. 20-1249]|uniref:YbaK/EbsC family protein n=1 Tax=Streptococcus hepaticus TaxID=3349163 RepID=UPI0037478C8F